MTSKLLQPIQVGNLTFKNRIMFPPLTTGYEERDGSIGPRSLAFYTRLAQGGCSYIVIGDVAPVRTASPTPKLYDESQIEMYKKLADALHEHDCKVALQLFHPEYDVQGVGKMIMEAGIAGQLAAKAKAANDVEEAEKQQKICDELTKGAYAKLHHDMQHFVTEASVEQLTAIKNSIAECARKAQKAGIDAIEIHGDRLLGSLCSKLLNHRTDNYGGSLENRTRYALEVLQAIKEAAPSMMVEYKLPIITVNPDGSLRGKGGLLEDEAVEFAKMLDAAGIDMIQVAQANHTGNMGDTIPPMGAVPYNWTLGACEKVKAVVHCPVATVGRVVSVEADFKEHNVQKFVNTRVSEIKDNVIYAVNTKDETNVEIAADTIVNALGSKKNVFDDSKLTVPFTYVGDCSGERTADIASAIRTGYKAANEI